MRLLTIASRPSDYAEMSLLADALAERAHHVRVVYFAWRFDKSLPEIQRQVALLNDGTRSIDAVLRDVETTADLAGAAPQPLPVTDDLSGSRMRRRLRVIARNIRYLHRFPAQLWMVARDAPRRDVPRLALQGWATASRYRRVLEFFDDEIARHGIDAVLIPEDIVGHIWPVAVKAAHARRVPALVFPYTLANQQEAVQSLRSEP